MVERCREYAAGERRPLLTAKMRQRIDSRGDRRLDAYYYSFDSTGNEDIDRLLGAVALAGKMYHSTEFWWDDDGQDGYSLIDLIQAAANTAAATPSESSDG